MIRDYSSSQPGCNFLMRALRFHVFGEVSATAKAGGTNHCACASIVAQIYTKLDTLVNNVLACQWKNDPPKKRSGGGGGGHFSTLEKESAAITNDPPVTYARWLRPPISCVVSRRSLLCHHEVAGAALDGVG